jgi:hypothetical protein
MRVSSWRDALARPAKDIRQPPDGQIFDVITNTSSPLSGHRCLSPRVVGWAIVADVGRVRGQRLAERHWGRPRADN